MCFFPISKSGCVGGKDVGEKEEEGGCKKCCFAFLDCMVVAQEWSFWRFVRVANPDLTASCSKTHDFNRWDLKAMIITSIITCCSACWRVTKVGKIQRTSVAFVLDVLVCIRYVETEFI